MVSRNQNCYIVYTDPSLIYYYLNRNDEMMMLKIEHVTSNSLKIQVRACKFKSLFTICPFMVNALFDVDRLRTSCEYNNYSTRLMQLSVKRSASGREKTLLCPLKCTNRITIDENKIASKPPGHNSRSRSNWSQLMWHGSLALHLWLNLEYYNFTKQIKLCAAAYLHKCKLSSLAKTIIEERFCCVIPRNSVLI